MTKKEEKISMKWNEKEKTQIGAKKKEENEERCGIKNVYNTSSFVQSIKSNGCSRKYTIILDKIAVIKLGKKTKYNISDYDNGNDTNHDDNNSASNINDQNDKRELVLIMLMVLSLTLIFIQAMLQ